MIRNLIGRTATASAIAAALIGGVVACSASDTTTPSASAAPSTGTDHQAFSDCLTAHGVAAPPDHGPGPQGGPPPSGERPSGPPPSGEPPSGPPPSGAPQPGQTPPAPPGVDSATWDSAMQACASLMPAPPAH